MERNRKENGKEARILKRCYFAPVAGIIRENFQEGCFDSRSEFAETLFESYLNGSEKTFLPERVD